MASFYPLQFITQRIGGDAVRVSSLTRPGAEPHDLELTPRDVAHLQDSDLVVYLSGFQPAVDDGIEAAGPPATFDAAPSADLDLTFTPIEDGAKKQNEAGSTDPHFWLDPVRLSAVATALEASMAQAATGRRRRLRAQPGHPAGRARHPGRRLPRGPGRLREPGPGDQPQRLRLPRPALRPAAGAASPA